MVDKSPLRLAREARGLSRKAVAGELGTTEHLYWHCEMPPFDGPADVLQAACAFLGVEPSTLDSPVRADLEASRGPRTWRCGECGHLEEQTARSVWHQCPRKGDRLVRLDPGLLLSEKSD